MNGSLVISPAALTITGATTSTTYDATAQTNGYTVTGLLGSDSVSSVSGSASGIDAGTYLDSLSGATGTGLSNCTITYVNGSLVIDPAAFGTQSVAAFLPLSCRFPIPRSRHIVFS